MQRRKFSFSLVTAASASALAAGLPMAAQAQAKRFKEGADYLTLSQPAPTQAPAGKIEVVEFFWYSCPHCDDFEPQFDAWVKKAPADVVVRRVPVAFRADFEPQQRLFYVLQAMGQLDTMHRKVFNAIHRERQALNTHESVIAWAVKQGLDKAKFTELYQSADVAEKVKRATLLQDSYAVDSVPSLGIAGRYYTSAGQAQTMERALLVTNSLVVQVRGRAS